MTPNTTSQLPDDSEADFTAEELAIVSDVRNRLEARISAFDARSKHRALLAVASELVDAAADVSAKTRPGVRVVELGILAERISQLACATYNATEN